MSEPTAAAKQLTCSQCSTPITIPEGETAARCPACGAMTRTGEGTNFGLGWRFAIAGNVLLLVFIGFVLLVMVNYLAYKYFIRRDATFTKSYSLSDHSKSLLGKVAEDKTKVKVFFLTGGGDQRTMEVVKHTLDLLEEYKLISGGVIEYEDRSLFGNPRAILEICDQTGVKPEDIEENEVLFYCESTKKNKAVKFYELYESDSPGGPGSEDSDSKYKFKGESVLTAGIQEVTEPQKTTLYFVKGHGEYGLSDFEQRGLSDLDRQLKTKENYDTKELNLASEGKAPADASAIVIVRPKTKFAPSECEALRKYLDGGGRMLLLFNTNREESQKDPADVDDLITLLGTWGVEVGKDYVYEADETHTTITVMHGEEGNLQQGTGPLDFNVTEYGYHDITKKLNSTATWFLRARSVGKAKQVPEGINVTELAKTTAQSLAVPETERGEQIEVAKCRRGPVSLAVAVEKAPPAGDKTGPKTRIVVLGDADSIVNASNQQFGRNALVANSLAWLVDKAYLMSGIDAVEQSDPKLNLSKDAKNRVGAITLIAMPGTCILLAVTAWLMRRK